MTARFRLTLGSLALMAALAAAACADDENPIEPTPDTPVSVTETFAGTIGPNGAKTDTFSVAASGTVQASLVKLEPDPAVIIGLSLGTWNGAACQVVLANDQTRLGNVLTATVSAAGRLCVRVYDAGGTLVEPATYEVTVVHP
jgi:hypothetical protein